MLVRTHTKYFEIVKDKKKIKTYYLYKNSNVFNIKEDIQLLLMSDLHGATTDIINDLIKKNILSKKTCVICTGDMAGNGKIGGNGDPYLDYVKIKDNAHSFFFVQGNHDVYNEKCKELKNDDGTYCHVEGKLQNTILGTISGLNGIEVIENNIDKDMHKFSEELYQKRLEYVLNLKPDILLTHQPINKDRLEKIYLPKIHMCGHYDIENFFQLYDNHTMINLDNKIIHFIA